MSASDQVAWIPALVTLGIGLVAGALLFLLARRSRRLSAALIEPEPVHARDLLAKRDALVRQLQEMEDTGSKRTAAQLARERYDLELETAQVLLALDAAGADAERKPARGRGPEIVPAAGAAPSPRAGFRGFLWGIGSATGLLLLVFFVWQSSRPREAGGSVTGDLPGARGEAADPAASDEAQIEAVLARNPKDVSAHLALAQLKLARRDLMGVWTESTRILELSPGNPRALTYQAVVRLAMGQAAMAVDLLRKAMAADPDVIETHAYLALGYARLGRRQEAEATVAAAVRRFPARADEFRRLLGEVDRGQPEEGAASDGDHPQAGLAVQDGPGTATSKAPRRHVAGRIDLDPSLAGAVRPGAVLFVFVRAAGVGAGPPVAVKRLAPVFPAAFDLSDDDAMMGQPFPDPILIEARLDEDGDPTTRPPTDPKARLDGIRAGRTDLRLVLKRP
jgi:tetratricopeptide (TPR) repeat protein